MGRPADLSKGRPKGMRKTPIFLRLDQMATLDQEIMRRKATGEDRGNDGKRIHVNRSLILRDLIDEKWPPEGDPNAPA